MTFGIMYPIDDRPPLPRIRYELKQGEILTDATRVWGDKESLNELFSIAADETTWGEIQSSWLEADQPKPVWVEDIETAASAISNEPPRTPTTSTSKFILNGRVYRVFTSGYQIFKDKRRCIYISLLKSIARPFDLKTTTGRLLSALILSVRFRERLIPMHVQLDQNDANYEEIIFDFYHHLQAVEIEALQY
jgi:hypothetical protein